MYYGDQRSRRLWQAEDGSGATHVPQHEGDAVTERSHQTGEVNLMRRAILFGYLEQSVSTLFAAAENCARSKLAACGCKHGTRTYVKTLRQLSPAVYLLCFPPVNYKSYALTWKKSEIRIASIRTLKE